MDDAPLLRVTDEAHAKIQAAAKSAGRPDAHLRVTPESLRSQGKNTPFIGYELPGHVRYTLVSGQVVYESVG